MVAKYFVMSKNPISKRPKKKIPVKNIIIISVIFLLIATMTAGGYFIINKMQKKTLRKIYLKRLKTGDYQLMVGENPYFVRGVCYIPTPIGKGYDYNLWDDPNKPWFTDGKLMKEMGINTVRFYYPSKNPKIGKEVIRVFYELYGIRSAIGHHLNFWNYPPPNYGLSEVRSRIKKEVIEMVKNYKDEPGVLFWILGNENNYSFDRNVNPWSTDEIEKIIDPIKKRERKAEIYYSFINDLAKSIKEIDPNHPIVMGNGELASIKIAKKLCTDVDILGGIIYTGRTFGSFWKRLKRNFGKPAVMIEFGCDSYNAFTQKETEDYQALFLKSLWLEIEKNRPGAGGEGNSLGGFVFEWTDEWWKYNEEYPADWSVHNIEGSWSNGSYYFDAEAENNMNEEWWGIVGLASSGGGIDKRVPKKAYYILKKLWKR